MYSYNNISLLLLLCVRNVSDKSCRENQYTLYISCSFFFGGGNHAVHEIMWKTLVDPDRPQMTIQ